MSKRFDIIVHGATGYTGRLVMRALLSDADSAVGSSSALKWAIAGRNEKKLMETKNLLKKFPEVDAAAVDAVPIVVADSMDEKQLTAMAKQTKVVLSLVGPYKLYGETLVKVCAENGVHYCDLSGETYWVSEMVEKYQATAEKSGAMLVNCCGMDSIPSDLTVFALASAVRKSRNLPIAKINLFLTKLKGGTSGATISSMITRMKLCSPAQLKAMANPFFLTDDATIADKQQRGLVAPNMEPLQLTVRKEPEIKHWSMFFFMARCNSTIVHRSNYLLGGLYGDSLIYRERLATPGGYFAKLFSTFSQFVWNLCLSIGPIRSFIARRVTQPGDGPTEKALHSGCVEITAFAYDAKNSLAAKIKVTGAGDPGYLLTSKMISECAKCLATDETNERARKGGFLTPASAFGDHLLDRLQRKHIFNFELEEL